MLELEEAVSRILAALPPPVAEQARLADASERVLAATVVSPINLPPFDNSAMDGYAVRAADVSNANTAAPTKLRIVGRVPAGENFSGEITGGECVRLFTGSPMPQGADAVVMQEDTRTTAGRPEEVLICDTARTGENVRRRGDDVREGAPVVDSGEILTAARIALLAALGIHEVSVGRRPIVGILATGSELREAGASLEPGQIFESNRSAIVPLIASVGGIAKSYPLVPDTLAATQASLEKAFAECDVVITSGGVSVGEMDFVKAAFEKIGGEMQFWKVAIRPGKPFVFGRLGEKFLFGLPGNPVSAFVTFLLLVRPALLRWQGARNVELRTHLGILGEALANSGDRRHFMRVRVDDEGKIFSSGRQASHVLSSLAAANGLLNLPPGKALAAGESTTVLRWD